MSPYHLGVPPMLVTLGDLVEDVVVHLDEPIRPGADTASRIRRRRGGSAANVAAAAAALGTRSRFIGRVGADATGTGLLDDLITAGVDVSHVQRGGSTGTVIAVVDATGERSMLTDRGACTDLDDPDRAWLVGATVLHVPLYSLTPGEPIATTATTVIEWAHEQGTTVSIDVSSTSVIHGLGVTAVRALLDRLAPDIVFANHDEAEALTIEAPVAGATTVVKRGAAAAVVYRPGHPITEIVPPDVVRGVDTTGAGDAFAAGFLGVSEWRGDPLVAVVAGHAAAARVLAARA